MAPERVLVTGGCGFVGAALVKRLAKAGVETVVLDDCRLGTPANLEARASSDNVIFETTNLEDPEATQRVLKAHSPEEIYHLAAMHFIPDCNRDPRGAVAANVVGTQSLFDACRDLPSVKAITIASSAAVYAPGSGPHRESDLPTPTDIYGLTKLWNEQQAALLHESTRGSIGVGIARLFNIFGPGETNEHLIPAILQQALAGGPLSLGNLDTRRDYVFVEDVVDALLSFPSAMEGGRIETCNIGTERQHNGHEVIKAVEDVLGRVLDVQTDPDRLRPSDRPNLLSDCSRAHTILNWSARVGLREGLEQSAARPLAPGSGARSDG